MILLLDASKIRIWDWDNDKLIFPQSENDFRTGYAEEINTLRDQYDFNQIKKIILIDTNPEPISSSVFRTEGYEGKYFESLFQEKSGYFYSLFRNTKVYNRPYLGLKNSSDPNSYVFNFVNIDSLNFENLEKEVGDDKIVFFSNFLTPLTIKILQHFRNIEGYYKPSISELKYEKILHTDEFLNLMFDLQTLNKVDYSTYKNKMAFSNINGVYSVQKTWTPIPQSLLNLKNLDQHKSKKLLIVGSEKYLIREVVSIIWGDKINIITFPSTGKIGIDHGCDGIIITDIDALLNEDGTITDNFTEFSLKLSLNALKEKIVILHSAKSISGINLPGFTRILLPDKYKDENYYSDYFYYMLKQKQLFTENSTSHQHNAAMWLVNSRSKIISSYLKKIPSLDDMDLLLDEIIIDPKLSVDFNYQDFWYVFGELVEKKYDNSSSTHKQTNYDFTFTLKKDPGSTSWEIQDNKTNKLIKESNVLAVMIVAYLVQHTNSENTIKTDELYETCKKNIGGKIGNYKNKGSKHNCDNALSTYLSSTVKDSPKFAKKLTEDQKDFRISLKKIYAEYCVIKKDYSYFKKNDEISINVIGL